MATLLKVLDNLADIKSAGGVALGLGTQAPTWGQAMSVLAQLAGVAPSGPTGWADLPATLTVPAWVCIGVALYVGAGAPGARGLVRSVNALAPNWLQYGVCLFLLTTLSTAGTGRFIYGQF
jgi:hypothetical protein